MSCFGFLVAYYYNLIFRAPKQGAVANAELASILKQQ
jgi:hypothetical protein